MNSARRRLLLSLVFVFSAALASVAEPADIASLRIKAEKGNAIAQYNLGLAYAEGRDDMGADLTQAYVWLSLSGDSGSSRKALSAVLARISDDQLAAAKRLLESYHGTPAARNVASSHGSTPKVAAPAPAAVSAPFVPVPAEKPAEVVRPAAPAPVESADADEIAGLRKDKRQLSDELAIAWKDNDKLKATLATTQVEAARAQQLSQELEQRGHDLSTALAEVAKDNERLAAQTATVGRLQEELAAQTHLAAQIRPALVIGLTRRVLFVPLAAWPCLPARCCAGSVSRLSDSPARSGPRPPPSPWSGPPRRRAKSAWTAADWSNCVPAPEARRPATLSSLRRRRRAGSNSRLRPAPLEMRPARSSRSRPRGQPSLSGPAT